MDVRKCWDCGRPVEGGSYCPSCLEKAKIRTEKWRQEARKQGLCRNCGSPAEGGHAYCPSCLEKQNEGINEMRAARRAQGLCEMCGSNPIFKAGHCEECYERKLKAHLARRDSYREAGLCVACGAPARQKKDGSFSPYCPLHEREYYGKRISRYWERRKRGLCVDCGEPVERDAAGRPLYARCPSCRMKKQEHKRMRKEGAPRVRKKC